MVADSALYNKDRLLKDSSFKWITRVPQNIKSCKELVAQNYDSLQWTPIDKNYQYTPLCSIYGDCKQRWIMIYSKEAYKKELSTLTKNIEKEAEKLQKQLWHLSNQNHESKKDLEKLIKKEIKSTKYYSIEYEIKKIIKYSKTGRPTKDSQQILVGFTFDFELNKDEVKILNEKNQLGRFVLATNELNEELLSGEAILINYKDQQKTERGFQFLKDPWFMVHRIFLKKPERIEALMMVMTLCLMVYNYGQWFIRRRLEQENETIPNQKKKPTSRPTLRWIFQIMAGIAVVRLPQNPNVPLSESGFYEIVTNVNETQHKLITLLGGIAPQIYGFP